MNTPHFRPHGVYSLHIEERILVIETSGPWNKEMIEQFGRDNGALIATLAGEPWAILATVTKDGMHTPDSYAAMIPGIRQQQAIGRCATAVILRDIEAPTVVRTILSRMYVEAGENFAFFDDSASARDWLLNQLAAKA